MFYVDIDGKRRRVYKQSDGAFYMYVTKRTKKNVGKKNIYEADPIPRKKKINSNLAGVMAANRKFQQRIQELEQQLDNEVRKCMEGSAKGSPMSMPGMSMPSSPAMSSYRPGSAQSAVASLEDYQRLVAERDALRSRAAELEAELHRRDTASLEKLSELETCNEAIAGCNRDLDVARRRILESEETMKAYEQLKIEHKELEQRSGIILAESIIGKTNKERCDMQLRELTIDFEERLAEKNAEIEKIRRQKDTEMRRLAEEKNAEMRRLAEEKNAEMYRLAEEKNAEMDRLQYDKDAEVSQREDRIQVISDQLHETESELKNCRATKQPEMGSAEMLQALEEMRSEQPDCSGEVEEAINRLGGEFDREKESMQNKFAEMFRIAKGESDVECASKLTQRDVECDADKDRISSEFQERITMVEDQRENCHTLLKEANDDVISCNTDKENLSQDFAKNLEDFSRALNDANTQCEVKLGERDELIQETRKECESNIAHTRDEVARLRDQMANLSRQYNELTDELSNKFREVENLKIENGKLNQTVEEYKHVMPDLDKSKEIRDELQRDIESILRYFHDLVNIIRTTYSGNTPMPAPILAYLEKLGI